MFSFFLFHYTITSPIFRVRPQPYNCTGLLFFCCSQDVVDFSKLFITVPGPHPVATCSPLYKIGKKTSISFYVFLFIYFSFLLPSIVLFARV
uniref:Uncharacterized protein n=1 Tax=Anguilla anguilla TaxID=7936 RepID=A0A0E9PZY0_ANGAN